MWFLTTNTYACTEAAIPIEKVATGAIDVSQPIHSQGNLELPKLIEAAVKAERSGSNIGMIRYSQVASLFTDVYLKKR